MESSISFFQSQLLNADELSRSSNPFRLILEACPDIVYLYDRVDECYPFVSGRSRDILGYPPEQIQKLKARDIEELIHPDDLEHAKAHYAKQEWLADSEVSITTYRVRTALGDYRLLRCRQKAFSRTPDGVVKCILGIATDITGEIRREREIDALRAQIVSIRDEERQNIALRMHDTAMQHLVGAALALRKAEHVTPGTEASSQSIRDAQVSISLALRELVKLSQ